MSVEGSVRTHWAVTGVCVSAVTVATAHTAQVSDITVPSDAGPVRGLIIN